MNFAATLNDAVSRPTVPDVHSVSLYELNDQLAREVEGLTRLISQLVYSIAVPAGDGPTAMAACLEALAILGSTTGLDAMGGLVDDLETLIASATRQAADMTSTGVLMLDEIDNCLDEIVSVARWAPPV